MSSVDLNGRALELPDVPWQRLFEPRRVAFVGASDTEGSQTRSQWEFLLERLEPLGCEMVPIHATKSHILGTRAYSSIEGVPGEIDVAVIAVRDPFESLDQCVARRVPFVIVFTSGFSELGTEAGREAEARIRDSATPSTRVIGPNTNLNIYERWRQDLGGQKLAIVTQSGFQGRPIAQGEVYGIAIKSWATLGNEADLEWADFVAYYAAQPDTGAVVTYVEGFRDGRSMMLAADAAIQAGVPLVIIKVGRSDEGTKMARAHTGHITGSDAVHDAVFAQFGVVRVDDIDEAVEISGMFCRTGPLRGREGVALYSLSGGSAAHLADLLGSAGVPIPRFEEATIETLAGLVPDFLHVANPFDSGGALAMSPKNRDALDALVADGNTNIILVPITGVFPAMIKPLVADLVALHLKGSKPILVIWASPMRDDPGHQALCDAGIPVFHSFGAAVRGISELLRFQRFRADYQSPFGDLPRVRSASTTAASEQLAEYSTMNEVDAKALLRSFGIPVVEETIVATAAEAATAVESFGGRAVLKAVSGDVEHKSDLGLVRVGVEVGEAAAVFDNLAHHVREKFPEADFEGVVVQRFVDDGVIEAILGLSHQEPFGPTVTFGFGGVFAEVLEDVGFGVPPFRRCHVEETLRGLRGAAVLKGVRGRSRGDVDALVDAIMALQEFAVALGDQIEELDLNPVIVRPEGLGVVAVDALLVPRTVKD